MKRITPIKRIYNQYTPITEQTFDNCCDLCMNDMELVKSTKGDYWVCRICNNVVPYFN